MNDVNTQVIGKRNLCEPCIANAQSIHACFFCVECENEFLCEPCGKHHTRQKSTRTHALRGISQYKEAAHSDTKNILKLCEPCIANKQSTPAFFFCAECENEFLCEPCGKHHTRQKSTRTHTLQDISKYAEAANTEVTNNQKMCEPCTANKKESPAYFFCVECENEFLCEQCGKHHTIQKSTRTHKLQDINQYMNILKLCELCAAKQQSMPACFFCAECENEFLCEPCGKHHNIQKSTRTHKLQDINQFVEVANAEVTNNQKMCEPCKANEKTSHACFFCIECENEFLCEPCGKQHTVQKSTRTHKLQDIRQYMNILKLCELCTANKQSIPACFFCAECENEFLCEPCGKHHNKQKSTRTHTLQDIRKYVEAANAKVTTNQKMCEPCTANEKITHACFFCVECEYEFLCDACGRYHNIQKATRTHKLQVINQFVEVANAQVTNNQKHTLQNIRKVVEVANAEVTNIQKLGEPSTVNEETEKSTPGKPSASAVGSDTITLTWNKPALFQKGDHFQIACREYKESRWKICYDNVEKNIFKLTNLKSDAQFVFRIRAVYNDYESNYSIESDVVKTRKSLASKLVCFSTSRSAADVLPIKYTLPMTEVPGARNRIGKTKKFEIGSGILGTWKEKTILLIGETGTGKSTLVDGMANFALGVNWNDEFRCSIVNIEDVERQKIGDQAVSQTEWITCYTMHPQDSGRIPYTINIIDTPGFGDTRGPQRDQEIVEQIRELFSADPPQGVSIIDAVCFLIKAPDARLTQTQSYIFQSIMSLFGKDIENNICSLITFADGLDPPVKTALNASQLPFGKWFTFNNSALFAKNTTIDPSSMSEMFWDMGLKSVGKFFEHLDSLPSTSLKLTSDVLKERRELEAIVRNLEPLLDAGLVTINSLNAQIKCFEENKSIIAENNDFTYTDQQTYSEMKKKYEEASGKLLIQEQLIAEIQADLNKLVEAVDELMESYNVSKTRLSEIALRPNPLTMKEHIDLLIENEKMFKKSGWLERIQTLHMYRKRADIVKNVSQFRMQVTSCVTVSNLSKTRIAVKALRPNPLTLKDHIDLMIENEKMDKVSGWLERIKELQKLRNQN